MARLARYVLPGIAHHVTQRVNRRQQVVKCTVTVMLASNGARFLYTGQAWLPDLGLYHYKARVYSPTLGRFLQTDPIGYNDQINLYAYVANDPVNWVDSTGKDGDEIVVTGRRPPPPPPALSINWLGLLRIVGVPASPLTALKMLVTATPTASDDDCRYCSYNKPPADAHDPNGAKAPGKPGEDEGFKDPPSGEKWGKGSDGRGGWVDKDGNIWKPTGQSGGRAHGGPHWDVEGGRGGSKGNVYPGGRTRPHAPN